MFTKLLLELLLLVLKNQAIYTNIEKKTMHTGICHHEYLLKPNQYWTDISLKTVPLTFYEIVFTVHGSLDSLILGPLRRQYTGFDCLFVCLFICGLFHLFWIAKLLYSMPYRTLSLVAFIIFLSFSLLDLINTCSVCEINILKTKHSTGNIKRKHDKRNNISKDMVV